MDELDVESGSSDGLVGLELCEVGPESGDEEIVVDVGVGAGAVVCEALMLEDLVELDAGRAVVLFADATGAIGWLTDDD